MLFPNAFNYGFKSLLKRVNTRISKVQLKANRNNQNCLEVPPCDKS